VQCPNHGIHSSYETGLHIKFPLFTTQAVLGTHDIYLNAAPANSEITCTSFLPHSDHTSNGDHPAVCKHIIENSLSSTETNQGDNIIEVLRQYYGDVKTKRQLNFEVPAGFRWEGNFQRTVRDIKNASSLPLPSEPRSIDSEIVEELDDTSTTNHDVMMSTSLPNQSSIVSVLILRCVDKPSSHLPARIPFTEDFLRASVGFRRIDMMKSHLSKLYQDTILLDKLPADAVLDTGEFANLRKTPRTTTPVPRPSSFGEVIHMDIVFGPDIAVGNIHYGLLFTDHYSHMTYLYPLQNLTSDIVKQLESFFAHLGFSPR